MATKEEAQIDKVRKENKKLVKENNKLQADLSLKEEQIKEKDLHIKFLTDRLSQWADKFFELRTNFINLPITKQVEKQREMQNGRKY
jgi:predicted nuclease with TOPRIM domain|tara:strand:+ start:4017 stop:4277 length:261 start_codon:yes stop_codon:yes gene_type:complete